VAVGAFLGCRLVEKNFLSGDGPEEIVTFVTFHIRVSALQWEVRAGVVIEGRWRPPLNIVTVGTSGLSFLRCKLSSVGVNVAGFAVLWRSLELNFPRCGLDLVALPTADRAMRPKQRKLRLGVIKSVHICPGLVVVARLTTEICSVGSLLRHPFAEFAFVGVLMACGAGLILEVKRQNFVHTSTQANLVALGTSNGHVCACQRERGFSVHHNRERSAMEILHGMAALALVAVSRG